MSFLFFLSKVDFGAETGSFANQMRLPLMMLLLLLVRLSLTLLWMGFFPFCTSVELIFCV